MTGLSLLAAAAALRAPADESMATAAIPHQSYSGTVVSVDAKEHTLAVTGILLTRDFNLGDNCAYTLGDQSPGTLGDLRPGERVIVAYQERHGVRVADHVSQQAQTYTGTVKACDPVGRTLTLHTRSGDRTFQLAGGCQVLLREDKSAAVGDIQTGDYVTVTYETPNDKLTAQKIAQTSQKFTGSLTAIDLEAKTVKAKSLLESKRFVLGDDCAIVVNGRIEGRLADLKPDDRLTFSYDNVNGVNVANRIAPAGTAQQTETTMAANP